MSLHRTTKRRRPFGYRCPRGYVVVVLATLEKRAKQTTPSRERGSRYLLALSYITFSPVECWTLLAFRQRHIASNCEPRRLHKRVKGITV